MQRMLRLPEMGRTSMKKTTWIVRTAVCLALLLVLQVATKSFGQFVTGSCVNLVLAMAALSGGLWSGVAVAVLSPFCAYALGIGPAFLQLVPCVALGNAVYAVLFALLVGKWLTAKPLAAWGSMVLAAVCKLAALYVVLVKLVAPMIVPAAKLTAVTAAFTWPQLVTALIGGGGKTTLLYTLTEELRKKGTVLLCTSTHIMRPTQYEVLERAGEAEISAALAAHGAVCVGEPSAEGKLGPPSLSFDALARLADYVLVEADGSRRLPLKAHAPHEPVIPANAQRVVLVVGADGFGKPIRDVCHRSERYAALCGVSENALVTPELEAALILAEGLGDRVYINKVETAEDYDRAAALANRLTCPVTAGSLHKGVYLCLR